MRPILRPDSLTDGSIALRPFTLDDVPAVTVACQDPKISKWRASIPWPYNESNARDWIGTHAHKWANGESAQFAVVSAGGDRFLGSFGFHKFDWSQGTAVAQYWIAGSERDQGIATRALCLGTDWAFEELGLSQIELMTRFGNIASERVAQKAGFEMKSEIRDFFIATAPDQPFKVKWWILSRATAYGTGGS
jgi:RimJ/RimL family protein N-acetyltransferase